jgi:hypothetical protein
MGVAVDDLGAKCSENRHAENPHQPLPMAKWKQYELWVQTGESKWEMIGVFPNTDLATTVANTRSRRARVIEVLYDGSKLLGQEIIAEIGTGRREGQG